MISFLKGFESLKEEFILYGDNAKIHKSEETITYLKENNWVYIFGPPYSPDMNPIEYLFNIIKAKLRILILT